MLYLYQIFIIHSSADGRLGWLHLLALVNRAMTSMQIKHLYDGVWSLLGLNDVFILFCHSLILGEVLNKPTTGENPPGKNPCPPSTDYYSPDKEKQCSLTPVSCGSWTKTGVLELNRLNKKPLRIDGTIIFPL